MSDGTTTPDIVDVWHELAAIKETLALILGMLLRLDDQNGEDEGQEAPLHTLDGERMCGPRDESQPL